MNLEGAQAEFLRIRPALKAVMSHLRDTLKTIVSSERIAEANISGRVKKPGSFSAKVEEKGDAYQPDPLARMPDKIGLRAELLHLDDVERVCERVRAGELGEVLGEEDKRAELGVDGIGYQGIHFDVRPDLPPELPLEWGAAEVQVRTMAQGVWAMANHEIAYKSPVAVSSDLHRRLIKMTVFMETFDEEVKRVREEVMNDEDYPLARLLDELAAQRARIGRPARQSSAELTRRLVEQLLGDDHDPVVTAQNLDAWMDDNEQRVKGIVDRYEDVGRQFYVDRPEGLLAFYLISTDKYGLAERWRHDGNDAKLLNDLFLAWGDPVPSPEAL